MTIRVSAAGQPPGREPLHLCTHSLGLLQDNLHSMVCSFAEACGCLVCESSPGRQGHSTQGGTAMSWEIVPRLWRMSPVDSSRALGLGSFGMKRWRGSQLREVSAMHVETRKLKSPRRTYFSQLETDAESVAGRAGGGLPWCPAGFQGLPTMLNKRFWMWLWREWLHIPNSTEQLQKGTPTRGKDAHLKDRQEHESQRREWI